MYRLFRKVKGNNKAGNENTPIVHECLTSETVFCGVEVDIYANRNYEVGISQHYCTCSNRRYISNLASNNGYRTRDKTHKILADLKVYPDSV